MRQVPIKLGPLALLLTIISICLTTLAILTYTTAEADRRLAERYGQTVETRYKLESQGQEFLRDVDRAIRDNNSPALVPYKTEAYNVYEKIIEDGDASLTVRIENDQRQSRILSWKMIRSWEEDKEVNVWNGLGW